MADFIFRLVGEIVRTFSDNLHFELSYGLPPSLGHE